MARLILGQVLRSTGYASRSLQPLAASPCLSSPAVYRRRLSTSIRVTTPHPSFPPIPFDKVQLVDPETNALRPAQPLRAILAEIDTSTHYPYLVSSTPPIVRIKAIAEVVAAAQQKSEVEATRKKIAASEKEVQVPWSAADGDLQRKLDLAREVLGHGDRVTIVFAPKAGGQNKKIDRGRMQEVVQVFEGALDAVGVKWRADEVTPKVRTLYYDPKGDVRKDAERRLNEHTREQKKASEEKKEARRRKDEERRRKSEERKRAAAQGGGQGMF
ncbi:hypothetical protein DB88DRAFT_495959 [Papiliotrema laurentii]|uniref:Translation initiation factor 3 N-terminal domain-containing protein n=1 Tax=Papiliotrema laurentii TaxID=5418 RepID=A0AAD9CV87_PAPLA|nr:hypothetical protein DB88DRAFT_495959 [Papiliotrema laurentii]